MKRGPCITGAELRAYRRAACLTQAQLGALAGFDRGAVGYWEAETVVPLRHGAPRRFAEALGLAVQDYWTPSARARAWGISVTNTRPCEAWGYIRDPAQERLDARCAADLERVTRKENERRAKARVICGAKTRAGHSCGQKSEPGKRRCKWHGGKSTGPKTPEGKARIADAQRRRWASFQRAGVCTR
jgi:transcriptional regulator with XRE-family HTH domain